jgi:hypothetical protein
MPDVTNVLLGVAMPDVTNVLALGQEGNFKIALI